MNKPQSGWDHDYAWGRQGELLIEGYWEALKNGQTRLETKTKRYVDLKFYVETECYSQRTRKYEPAGINITQSEVWAYVIGDTGMAWFIPTSLLKRFISHSSSRDKQEVHGRNPTKGKLINLPAVMAVLQGEMNRIIAPELL